jgi:hypothetical protein
MRKLVSVPHILLPARAVSKNPQGKIFKPDILAWTVFVLPLVRGLSKL